jgi:GH18 family chitinase
MQLTLITYCSLIKVCINQKRWKRFWEPKQQAPYGISGNQWLSYDDVESIGIKVKYANDKGLAGAMVWSIDFDDFRNDCGRGKFPLLNKIKSGLRMTEPEDNDEESENYIDESSQELKILKDSNILQAWMLYVQKFMKTWD